MDSGAVIPPGATVGILGGGQLGRMIALAAARLGYRAHVFCPERAAPALQVAAAATVADYGDGAALDRFADAVDVATLEFENIPLAAVERVAARAPMRPGARALAAAQDRLAEKDLMARLGVATAAFAPVDGPESLADARTRLGGDCILKTVRMGYDGKGQTRVGAYTDPDSAWRAVGGAPAILEARVDFVCEVSVVLARGLDRRIVAYDPVENRHVDGILHTTVAPARIDPAVAAAAHDAAARIAEALDVVGLLAVEMFVTRDGRVLVNEIAPRPHNSGHWTIDACVTSQFEQAVRAVCGLPLGAAHRLADAVMHNLLGRSVEEWRRWLADPDAKLHIYGKAEPRPGRKMGHVTQLLPDRSGPFMTPLPGHGGRRRREGPV